jgi:hypothetical protein
MNILNTYPEYYSREQANRIAKELSISDPEWQYKVINYLNTNYCIIKVIDEQGKFVGYWN